MPANNRLLSLDVLRGFTVAGIMQVHADTVMPLCVMPNGMASLLPTLCFLCLCS